MMRTRVAAWVAVAVLAAVIAGCGSDNNKSSSSVGTAPTTAPATAKKGGTLTMLASGDVDNSFDPGYSYYQYDFILDNDLHRTLFRYKPGDTTKPSPDLADGEPQISQDGKTITIKIKQGIKFSPPVNREVKADDVLYAFERDFTPKVSNGYAKSYWSDIIGANEFYDGKAKTIKGITTPDDYTLVFKLKQPTAAIVIGAMALPGTAPVPRDYAKKYDAGDKPTYGLHLVSSGPYMVQNDAKGNLTGYKPGKSITLVRNPNWDPKTDWRPAYLDKIVIQEGEDPTVGNRKVLQGQNLIGNPVDLAPTPAFLKQNLNGSKKDQFVPSPYTGRTRWIALNTAKKPFDDPNIRKAVFAGIDRKSMTLAFGGETTGKVATHIIPPGVSGFDEAGGLAGPDFDYIKNPEGDPQVAAEYLKKAGFADGKYKGPKITMVADNAGNQKGAAQVVLDGLQKLGFNVTFRAVTRDTMFSKYCSVPKNEPEVCPSVGWLKDFADPQTMVDPVFNSAAIIPAGNVAWSQLRDKSLDEQMNKAKLIVGDKARAEAWGKIDQGVIGTAAAIPWMWDKPYLVKSDNVNAVLNQANAAWDLSSMSVK